MQIDRAMSLLLAGHAIRRASWIGRKDNDGEILDRAITACDGGFCFSGRRTIFGREQDFASSIFLNNADLSADDWEVTTPASPQPVAPTGEIAGRLQRLAKVGFGYDIKPEDRTALREAAAALTSLSAERDRQREHIRKQAEDIMTLGKLVYASETETWKDQATSLRRKLEELRQAYESARYVPGDHPIVPVKIDALMKVCARTLSGASE